MAIVVISAGQSNAEGGTYYAASANGQNGPYARTYVWHKNDRTSTLLDGSWQLMHFDGMNTSHYGGAARAAYELEVATQLEAIYPSEDIYVIKVAIGSTGLDSATAEPMWSPGGTLRKRLIEDYALPALNELASRGISPKVTMVWSQGEADSSNSAIAGRYKDNCKALFAEVRQALNMPSLPIFVMRMSSTHIHTYKEVVQAHQDAIAAEDKNVFLMNTDGLPKDDIGSSHYTTYGYQLQGRAIAHKIAGGFWTEYKPKTLHDIAAVKGSGALWMDESDVEDGSVSSWTNRFGGYGAVQAVAANRPDHVPGAVQFRRVDSEHLDITGSSTAKFQNFTQNMVFFASGVFASTGEDCVLFDTTDSTLADRIILQSRRKDSDNIRKIGYLTDVNGWVLTPVTTEISDLMGQHCVIEFVLDDTAASGRLYINGKLFHTGSYTPRRIGNRVCLGSRWDDYFFLEGDVSAFAMFRSSAGQGVLSDAERAAVRTGLFYR
jgi:hypothetical protein